MHVHIKTDKRIVQRDADEFIFLLSKIVLIGANYKVLHEHFFYHM